ncbi:hypothetical protein C5C18_11485 [Rathayibacter tritici]|uniref:MmpS family transport accessory protein n=1 Tax=Rathayibacter tritici TaxID=33888 RepID=UPI000CE75006|nr:MmpS family transport accessory protein [Rathayibacter tritici]PPF29905.1 hypothetical protein C5C06_06110 [Rathayibacter tritici]PPF65280.1 hypothetical protein C5C21_10910 [Rathayibacter tritici]PPG06036.1 hypothetical protein C5C18_11485 [Rathayibacter tritici]PPI19915.1 hypothetical protein C5D07_00835 [Rathayibacter tritici]
MTEFNPAVFPDSTPAVPKKTGNGLGLASLIIGILALVGALIPIVNYVSGFLAFIGLVLGVIGLFLKGRSRGTAIAGAVLNAVALILSIILAIVYTAGFASGVSDAIATAQAESSEAAAVPRTLVYEVSGTAASASITWSTFDGTTSGSEQATGQVLPFTKELQIQTGGDFTFQSFTLSALNGVDDEGDISCRITLDGEVVAEHTSTGAFASALCTATPE